MSRVDKQAVSTVPGASGGGASTAWRYLLTAAVASVLIFGALRSTWAQSQVLLPYTLAQQRLAGWAIGLRELPVVVGFSCTGADVIALCLGAILVFPAPWRKRLVGAVLGLVLISVLNTVRIGNLSAVAGDKPLFRALHVFVWPAVMILAVCGLVYLWMRWAGRDGGDSPSPPAAPTGWRSAPARFAVATVVLVVAFVAAGPWYLESVGLQLAARWAAATGGAILATVHSQAHVAGNVLTTAYGSFAVTPTCIASPLIPVYLAAALVLPRGYARRLAWLAAAPFVFFALGTARLLVLAVPPVLVASPFVAIHAFNQVVFGALLVALAAGWATVGGRIGQRWLPRCAAAFALGAIAAIVVGGVWHPIAIGAADMLQAAFGHGGHGFADEQQAAGQLPAYQLGLLAALIAALWQGSDRRWVRLIAGAAVLLALQIVLFAALGELWTHRRWLPHVRDIRAWAVLGPLLVAGWWRREEIGRMFAPEKIESPVGVAG